MFLFKSEMQVKNKLMKRSILFAERTDGAQISHISAVDQKYKMCVTNSNAKDFLHVN